MDSRFFKSENPEVLASAIQKAIRDDRNSEIKAKMREGVDYYGYKHDILSLRLFYIDDTGRAQEEKNRSNIRIAHPFFTEQVDQKVQVLLSEPLEVKAQDDEKLQEYLDEYINEAFQVMLQELVEGSSKKAIEFVYAKLGVDDRLTFQVADSLKVIEVYNSNNQLSALIRYYDEQILKDGKLIDVLKAELWNDKQCWYFEEDENRKLKLDKSVELNPRPHIVVEDDKGQVLEKEGGFGRIPFFKLKNNKAEKTDLEPIKALIDDYDLMSCSLSNNLVDFDHPIYAVRGYPGDDLDKLVTNLKTKKTVGISEGGGVEVKTVDIPVEARKAKLALDKEGIYKFGMAFDSSQLGDGNITNVVIKSRYALLDIKCNKAETRLRQLVRELLEHIVEDINRRFRTAYTTKSIEIIVNRSFLVNENDLVEQEKVESETKKAKIDTILSIAPRLPDETVLNLICQELGLNFEEVQELLEEQDYPVDLGDSSKDGGEDVEVS